MQRSSNFSRCRLQTLSCYSTERLTIPTGGGVPPFTNTHRLTSPNSHPPLPPFGTRPTLKGRVLSPFPSTLHQSHPSSSYRPPGPWDLGTHLRDLRFGWRFRSSRRTWCASTVDAEAGPAMSRLHGDKGGDKKGDPTKQSLYVQ